MAGRVAEDARAALDAATLGVCSAVVEPTDARERDRGGTHRARFERHVEIAAREPLAIEGPRRLLNREDFRVRGRVLAGARQVVRLGDHGAIRPDDHGADRNLAEVGGRACQRQRPIHMACGGL